MPTFKPRTRAASGEGLTQALESELATYEKVGLFARAINPRSAYRYRGVLLQYQKALQGNRPTLEASRCFLARLRQDGFKASTLHLNRAALRGFHAWRGEQLVFPVKVPRHLPGYHSAELVDRILAVAEGKPRDHIILRLMSDAGLRRGEVISLRVRDVDLTGGMIRIRGKGDRVVPLTEELQGQLEQFCRGKALDDTVVGVKEKAVYRVVKKYAALAGEPNLHPHDLRHAFATRPMEGNANIRAVQELLGHADLMTTAVYLGVVPKHLEQAIQILGEGSGNSGRPSAVERLQETSPKGVDQERSGEDKRNKAADAPKDLAQRLARELDEQTSPLKSYTCYKLELKAESDPILAYLKQRFATWEGWRLLNEVDNLLTQRRELQEQIQNEALNWVRDLGTVGLVGNFNLATYHYLVRGDDSWLRDEQFQVVTFGPAGTGHRHLLNCPRCSYNIVLEAWDNREFLCPEHGAALLRTPEVGILSPRVRPAKNPSAGLTTAAYLEDVVPIEDLMKEYPGWEAGLSMRIPGAQPFSEWIIGVDDVPSMPSLVDFIRDFLRQSASSRLGVEVRQNEGNLADKYNKLLDTLGLTTTGSPAG